MPLGARLALGTLLALALALPTGATILDVEDRNDALVTAPIVFLNTEQVRTRTGVMSVECQSPGTVTNGLCSAPAPDDDYLGVRGLRARDRLMVAVHPTADFTDTGVLPAGHPGCDPNDPAGRFCAAATSTTCSSEADCPAAELCSGDGLCSSLTYTHCDTDADCPLGQCSITTTASCRIDADCPGGETCSGGETCEDNFSGYAGPTGCFERPDLYLHLYRVDYGELLCSGGSDPCSSDTECTAGSCSLSTATSCHVDADCPASETCGGGQTCEASGAVVNVFTGAACPFLHDWELGDPERPNAPSQALSDCLASSDDTENSDVPFGGRGPLLRVQIPEDGDYFLRLAAKDLRQLGSYLVTVTVEPNIQCNDGVDNDGDGLVDRLGGFGRFCSLSTTEACVTSADCEPRCSTSQGTACMANADCPAGSCSVTSGMACHLDADCPASETCLGGETCDVQTCDTHQVAADLGCSDFNDASEQRPDQDNLDNDEDGEVDEPDECPVSCFGGC